MKSTTERPQMTAEVEKHLRIEIPKVYRTFDYSIFSSMEGNRDTNPLHVNALARSMKEKFLISPIIVNENYEIIDGQHRFEAIKTLGLPLYFLINKGYGLEEVQRLNENMRKWSPDDYMNGYANAGNINYIIYREFRKQYSLPHAQTFRLLTGNYNHPGHKKYDYTREWRRGEMVVSAAQLKQAKQIIETILTAEPYYDGVRRMSYFNAIMELLQNPNFNHKEFVRKLKFRSTEMVDCTTVDAYIALIEDIYNFKRQNKVNLRF